MTRFVRKAGGFGLGAVGGAGARGAARRGPPHDLGSHRLPMVLHLCTVMAGHLPGHSCKVVSKCPPVKFFAQQCGATGTALLRQRGSGSVEVLGQLEGCDARRLVGPAHDARVHYPDPGAGIARAIQRKL